MNELVVFLGPSLPAAQARRIARCRVLPPARQGDVWRALALGPRAIALVDGVFEAQPSVWHHELRAALDAGVPIFGASSMGALRAAELAPFGMVGVGQVFAWVRDGVVLDDAEVALLHADAEHAFRPLTLPLVEVRHRAALARAARVLRPAEERALVAAAARVGYQERSWEAVAALVPVRARARWPAWLARSLRDREEVKAADARACIALAARAQRLPVRAGAQSSWVRRRRLLDGASRGPDGALIANEALLAALRARPDAAALEEAGLRRALLAGQARALGLAPSEREIARAERDWLASLGATRDRARFLAASGLDDAQARRLCEDLALERLVLAHAERLLADGPSALEALADEARLRGFWAAATRR